MTAWRHAQFTIECDARSCPNMYRSEWDVARADVRKLLARRGWTHVRSERGREWDDDYCPAHAPDVPGDRP